MHASKCVPQCLPRGLYQLCTFATAITFRAGWVRGEGLLSVHTGLFYTHSLFPQPASAPGPWHKWFALTPPRWERVGPSLCLPQVVTPRVSIKGFSGWCVFEKYQGRASLLSESLSRWLRGSSMGDYDLVSPRLGLNNFFRCVFKTWSESTSQKSGMNVVIPPEQPLFVMDNDGSFWISVLLVYRLLLQNISWCSCSSKIHGLKQTKKTVSFFFSVLLQPPFISNATTHTFWLLRIIL